METIRTYLDHNATTPLRPEAAAGLRGDVPVGNPSSVHAEGRRARALVEGCRERIAASLGAGRGEVVFTSGGSEANAMALRPGALRCPRGRPVERLLVGPTEHASVLDGHRFGIAVSRLRVGSSGVIDLADLSVRLRDETTPTLVSIQAANSETGVLQPLGEIAALVREAGATLHVDAVQAVGRIPLALAGLDAVSVSSHKLGGPTGVGALVVRQDRLGPAAALIGGGGQQRGLRAGTENVAGIVGFAAAWDASMSGLALETGRLAGLRDAAERWVLDLAPSAVVFGADVDRLPNTLAFAVPELEAQTALMALDLAGIAVSSGSACSSGKVGRSHVLAAMGVADGLAACALRVSFGWTSTEADVERFGEAFASVLQRLYDRRTPRAA